VPGEGKCNGIYGPVHGSAPDIAGKGIVNPVGQIAGLATLLRYSLGLLQEASAIEHAVAQVLDSKDVGGLEIRTPDLGGNATTSDVGDACLSSFALNLALLRALLADTRRIVFGSASAL